LFCCFAALRQIRSIERSISKPVLQSLVVSMVLTRLDYGSGTLAGIPGRLMDILRSSVLNAAARLVISARKYDHITPLLHELHCMAQLSGAHIAYRLAVLAFQCQRSLAPSYLSDEPRRASDVDSRRRLRSASTAVLVVQRSKHSTIGDRAFPVAKAKIWNTLPADVTSAPSLPSFKRRLKNKLIKRWYASDSANILSLKRCMKTIDVT